MFQTDTDFPPPGKPTDWMLREAGFTIHARPPMTEARWARDGKVYTESQAWGILNAEAVGGKT